jgi:hypothetical protein
MKFPASLRWPQVARRGFLRFAGAAALAQVAPGGAAGQTAPAPANSTAPDPWSAGFAAKNVWGYINKHSVREGESFDVMLSTRPGQPGTKGRIEFHRVGAPAGQAPDWAEDVTVDCQEMLATSASVGAGWYQATTINSGGWRPGVYLCDFVDAATGQRDAAVFQLIVRSAAKTRDLLVKLGTNTYQAYNLWGGHSLYERGTDLATRGVMVTFDRPERALLLDYDIYLIQWLEALAEKNGFAIDYASNYDIHRDKALLLSARLAVSSAHDEYWSKEEFDAHEERIHARGGNTIFFGANAGYWQVRYLDVNRPPDGEDMGRQMLCWKTTSDPLLDRKTHLDKTLLSTNRFRDGGRRPETMLMGVGYQNWFSGETEGVRYPYYVAAAGGPLFAGTGYKTGDAAADVVGYEWDNRDPDGDGKRLWDKAHSRIALLPEKQLDVLFRGEAVGADGKPGVAEAVYFRSGAGAKVFSSGSIRWAWGLGKPGFEREDFKKFNENLVLDFLK